MHSELEASKRWLHSHCKAKCRVMLLTLSILLAPLKERLFSPPGISASCEESADKLSWVLVIVSAQRGEAAHCCRTVTRFRVHCQCSGFSLLSWTSLDSRLYSEPQMSVKSMQVFLSRPWCMLSMGSFLSSLAEGTTHILRSSNRCKLNIKGKTDACGREISDLFLYFSK